MLGVDGVGEQRVQADAHLFLTIFFVLDLEMKQNTARRMSTNLLQQSLTNELSNVTAEREKSLGNIFYTDHTENQQQSQRTKNKVNFERWDETNYPGSHTKLTKIMICSKGKNS